MTEPRKAHPLNVPMRRCSQRSQLGDSCLTGLNLPLDDYAILMAARFFFASFAQLSVVLHASGGTFLND